MCEDRLALPQIRGERILGGWAVPANRFRCPSLCVAPICRFLSRPSHALRCPLVCWCCARLILVARLFLKFHGCHQWATLHSGSHTYARRQPSCPPTGVLFIGIQFDAVCMKIEPLRIAVCVQPTLNVFPLFDFLILILASFSRYMITQMHRAVNTQNLFITVMKKAPRS